MIQKTWGTDVALPILKLAIKKMMYLYRVTLPIQLLLEQAKGTISLHYYYSVSKRARSQYSVHRMAFLTPSDLNPSMIMLQK